MVEWVKTSFAAHNEVRAFAVGSGDQHIKGSTDLTTNGHESTRMPGPRALILLVFIRVHSWLH